MSRTWSSWSLIAVWAVYLGVVTGAQGAARSYVQRDGQVHERRIPVGTSVIFGTVTATDNGRPMAGARVTVFGQAKCAVVSALGQSETMWLTRTVITDSFGQFSFPRLPPGTFRVSVSALQNQFFDTNYGQRRRGGEGQILHLADGQQIALNVPVMRGGVIGGVVRGPDGEPLQNVQVGALRYDTSSGGRRLQAVDYAQTDDRGAYRIFGLEPGEYLISATPDPSRLQAGAEADLVERAILSAPATPPRTAGLLPTIPIPKEQLFQDAMMSVYLPTYAPSSMATSGATTVTVAWGEERTGVDIRAQFVPAANIKGVVRTPLDAGVTVQLWLFGADQATESWNRHMTRMDKDGTFTFAGVAPGVYTVFAQTLANPTSVTFVNGQPVQATAALTDAQKMWSKTVVTVSGEATVSAVVDLQASRSISGVIAFDMREPPDLTRVRLTAYAMGASSTEPMRSYHDRLQAVVAPDGRFTITGVPSGRYRLGLDGHFYLKSAVVSGQDTLDFPIEFTGDRDVTDAVLTVNDRAAELNGTLTDSTGKPALDHIVIVAATDNRFWSPQSRRVRMARLDMDGRYVVTPLPAGSYQISVVNDVEPGALSDPEFLRTLARTSIGVMITDGGKITQNLRVK